MRNEKKIRKKLMKGNKRFVGFNKLKKELFDKIQ